MKRMRRKEREGWMDGGENQSTENAEKKKGLVRKEGE